MTGSMPKPVGVRLRVARGDRASGCPNSVISPPHGFDLCQQLFHRNDVNQSPVEFPVLAEDADFSETQRRV
jgi:hypothetical protein